VSDEADDRIHPASSRRLDEARRQGSVAHSGQLSIAVLLLAVGCYLEWSGLQLVCDSARWLRDSLAVDPTISAERYDALAALRQSGGAVLTLAGGLLLTLFAAGLCIEVLQVGLVVAWPRVLPESSRLTTSGWQRVTAGLSLSGFVGELLRLGAPLACLLLLICQGVPQTRDWLWHSPRDLALAGHDFIASTCLQSAGSLLVVGLFHWGLTRWKRTLALQMSDAELREEQKHARRRG
jgi:flagellar biosynthesis protein FlhB